MSSNNKIHSLQKIRIGQEEFLIQEEKFEKFLEDLVVQLTLITHDFFDQKMGRESWEEKMATLTGWDWATFMMRSVVSAIQDPEIGKNLIGLLQSNIIPEE